MNASAGRGPAFRHRRASRGLALDEQLYRSTPGRPPAVKTICATASICASPPASKISSVTSMLRVPWPRSTGVRAAPCPDGMAVRSPSSLLVRRQAVEQRAHHGVGGGGTFGLTGTARVVPLVLRRAGSTPDAGISDGPGTRPRSSEACHSTVGSAASCPSAPAPRSRRGAHRERPAGRHRAAGSPTVPSRRQLDHEAGALRRRADPPPTPGRRAGARARRRGPGRDRRPRSAPAARPGPAGEALEDQRPLLGRHAGTVVLDRDLDVAHQAPRPRAGRLHDHVDLPPP